MKRTEEFLMLKEPKETMFLMEDEDGFLARVPESKVQNFGTKEPMNSADKQMIEEIVQMLLAHKK